MYSPSALTWGLSVALHKAMCVVCPVQRALLSVTQNWMGIFSTNLAIKESQPCFHVVHKPLLHIVLCLPRHAHPSIVRCPRDLTAPSSACKLRSLPHLYHPCMVPAVSHLLTKLPFCKDCSQYLLCSVPCSSLNRSLYFFTSFL